MQDTLACQFSKSYTHISTQHSLTVKETWARLSCGPGLQVEPRLVMNQGIMESIVQKQGAQGGSEGGEHLHLREEGGHTGITSAGGRSL